MLGICCPRMPLEDFVSNFSELIICRLFNTNIFTISRTWCEMVIKGNWSVGAKGTSQDRSGGGPTFTDTYLRNPQVYKHFLFDCELSGFCSTASESLYSRMWLCITGWWVYDISRQCGGFIFRGHCVWCFSFGILSPEDETTMLSWIVRNESPRDVVTHASRWLPFELFPAFPSSLGFPFIYCWKVRFWLLTEHFLQLETSAPCFFIGQ